MTSNVAYVYYPDPALPLSTVNYCAQSCDVLLFRKQPNDRSASDTTYFTGGKTLFSSESNAPVGTPFPSFRSHADYIRYKRMNALLTLNYASDKKT